MKAVLLGTSGAWPIPRPGCDCPQCAEARADPSHGRTRTGLYLETPEECVLIDAGPDVALQLERKGGSPRVDRVVITHRHLDHVLGLDDVAHLRDEHRECLPVHINAAHHEKVGTMFRHLLRGETPRMRFLPWGAGETIRVGDVTLEGFETGHRERFPTTGVILHVPTVRGVQRVAFATDMGDGEPSPPEALAGVDLFVGDGTYLGEAGYGHPGTTRMIDVARAHGARRVAITHVGHWRVAYADARAQVEESVAICRDGDDLFHLLGAELA